MNHPIPKSWISHFGKLLLTALWVFVLKSSAVSQKSEPTPEKASNGLPISNELTSVASCLTSGCHGSRQLDAPLWQRAGRIWFDDDPHAKAYSHLLTERSLQIGEKLLHRSFRSDQDEDYQTFLEQRCISCHASQHETRYQLVLGADCQVCHGPTKSWGDEHYSTKWRELKSKRFDGTPMLNTENLVTRAQICVSCHVGDLTSKSMKREVDHDLMAAGHPPMHFEFETFLRAYPVHWDVEQDKKLFGKEVSHERWRIGQLVSVQARLQMLLDRAEAAQNPSVTQRVWPELTEYSCYGCHHSLAHPSWRQSHGANQIYDWDAWSLAGLEYAIPSPKRPQLVPMIAELRKATGQHVDSLSSIQATANQLKSFVMQELDLSRSESDRAVPQIKSDLERLLQESSDGKSWEASTQWYCAVIAHIESLSTLDRSKHTLSNAVSDQINREFLNGPVSYHPIQLDSNRKYLEELLRKAQP